MKKIVILYGGPSSENEVSQSSKEYFIQNLKQYKPVLAEWLSDFSVFMNENNYSLEDFLKYLKENNCLLVNACHGEYCEDGYIQTLLGLNGIEYTGSDSTSSMLTMDKYESMKRVSHIVKCVRTYKVDINKFNFDDFRKYIGNEFPIFAKPNDKGSSVGTKKINNRDELFDFIKKDENTEYIFQPFISGIEISIGTVKYENEFLDLYPTEILPNSDYFDYKSKYETDGAVEITSARISEDLTEKLKALSREIHDILGLGYYSRTDFIIKDNEIYFLETNSLPGMSATSILPRELKYSNLEEKFFDGLLRFSIKPVEKNICKNSVNYYSQYTLEENNVKARANNYKNVEDGFESSGAKTMEEYLNYSDYLCGVACIQMILKYFTNEENKIFELFYDLKNREHFKNMEDGLIYENIEKFFLEHKLNSRVYRVGLTLEEIITNLINHKLCALSIKWKSGGSHLVLTTGYDLEKQCLYINDPSGNFTKNGHKDVPVKFDDFDGFLTSKGFVVWK